MMNMKLPEVVTPPSIYQVHNVDCWNKLLTADQDHELLEELNRVISDSIIPDGKYYNTNNNVGIISEAPTNLPVIYNQEVFLSDAYINMELLVFWDQITH